MRLSKQRGFSLLELVLTVSLALIMCAVTFISMRPMLNAMHVDSAYSTTLMALRNTRSLAIAQSNEYYVYFNPAGFAAGTIEVVVQPYSNGVAQPQSEVAAYTLPSDVSFAVQTGFPNTTAGTPDGFGTAANAIEFGEGLAGAPFNYLVFYPDGSSQDGQGNYNSGIVYLTRTGDTLSNSRAVTVWGATGRVRGWRLVQSKGVWEWVQQ